MQGGYLGDVRRFMVIGSSASLARSAPLPIPPLRTHKVGLYHRPSRTPSVPRPASEPPGSRQLIARPSTNQDPSSARVAIGSADNRSWRPRKEKAGASARRHCVYCGRCAFPKASVWCSRVSEQTRCLEQQLERPSPPALVGLSRVAPSHTRKPHNSSHESVRWRCTRTK